MAEDSDAEIGLSQFCGDAGYDSLFEADSEAEKTKRRRTDLTTKPNVKKTGIPPKDDYHKELDRDASSRQRFFALSLNAYDRHKKLINDYLLYFPGSTKLLQRDASKDKTDMDVLRENHRFLWEADDEADTWEKKLAKKYYDKLFKEYCICDLRLYKENRIAMRFRTQQEVVVGKGQFECGERNCTDKQKLRTWEVNFGYKEQGEHKNALVKLRLCPQCSIRLNYKHKRREIIPTKKKSKEEMVREVISKDQKSNVDKNDEGNSESPMAEKVLEGETIWKQSAIDAEEKSREEEFEEYLADLLL